MTAKYVSQAQCARMLGIGTKKLRRLVAAGVIVPIDLGDHGNPVYSLDRIAAAEQRLGELDAERRA